MCLKISLNQFSQFIATNNSVLNVFPQTNTDIKNATNCKFHEFSKNIKILWDSFMFKFVRSKRTDVKLADNRLIVYLKKALT